MQHSLMDDVQGGCQLRLIMAIDLTVGSISRHWYTPAVVLYMCLITGSEKN